MRVQAKLGKLIRAQEQLHGEEEVKRVAKNRAHFCALASKSNLPNSEASAYVMVSLWRKLGTLPKLLSTWTVPKRVVSVAEAHFTCSVKSIFTGNRTIAHVAGMFPYENKPLPITKIVAIHLSFRQGSGRASNRSHSWSSVGYRRAWQDRHYKRVGLKGLPGKR